MADGRRGRTEAAVRQRFTRREMAEGGLVRIEQGVRRRAAVRVIFPKCERIREM